jgi:hypothetical protein
VWIDTTINPRLVKYERSTGEEDYYFFYIERGETKLRDEGDDCAAGIQFNLFGLTPKDIENSFGWGGPRGHELHGTYLVVSSGIGTGGILWVALQRGRPATDAGYDTCSDAANRRLSLLRGQATIFLSCSERFKERVALPIREAVREHGMFGVIVSEEPMLPRTSGEPDSKVES